MSAAVAEPIVIHEQKVQEQHVAEQKPIVVQEKPIVASVARAEVTITDHPMVPVAIALILAAFGAVAFVGSIVFWLAVRHSGVVAP